MKNKTLEFIKNGLIATIPFMAGGIGGAELADLVTDSNAIITATSTVSQYILGYTTFMGMHAHDNRDVYRSDGKWDYKKLAIDTGKTIVSLGVAELAYIFGRSWLMDYFLSKDYSSTKASLMADAIAIPGFFGIALPIAKKTGLIKS